MLTNINNTDFKGIKIVGTVPAKHFDRLKNFTSRVEIQNLTKDLESYFDADIVLNQNIDTVSFSHPKYGNLTHFGCPYYQLDNMFMNISQIMTGIKSAITKAEKESVKEADKSYKRGC